MGLLFGCGLCCMMLSIWGFVQLVFMGIFYRIEAFTLIEDAEEHEYEDTIDFIRKTEANYEQLSINCWAAAVLYLLTACLCSLCIIKARRTAKAQEIRLQSDELSCRTDLDAPKKK